MKIRRFFLTLSVCDLWDFTFFLLYTSTYSDYTSRRQDTRFFFFKKTRFLYHFSFCLLSLVSALVRHSAHKNLSMENVHIRSHVFIYMTTIGYWREEENVVKSTLNGFRRCLKALKLMIMSLVPSNIDFNVCLTNCFSLQTPSHLHITR